MRDDVLHLGRVLRRAVEVDAAVFLRHRVGDLPLEIELLLPADVELAREPARRRGHRGRRIAALQVHRRQHVRLQALRLLRRQHRRQHLVVDLGQARGAPRGVVRCRRRRRTSAGRRTGRARRRGSGRRGRSGRSRSRRGCPRRSAPRRRPAPRAPAARSIDRIRACAFSRQARAPRAACRRSPECRRRRAPRRRRAGAPTRADAATPAAGRARCRAMKPSACRFIRVLAVYAAANTLTCGRRQRVVRPRLEEEPYSRFCAVCRRYVGARPHVGQRRVVGGERGHRRPRGRLGPGACRRARARWRARASASPPCRRRRRGSARCAPPSSSMRERGADGRDVGVVALRQLVGAEAQRRAAAAAPRSPRVSRPRPSPSSCSRRRDPPAAASRDRSRLRSVTVAPSAISPGIESPIGEPFATLPPIVPALRIGGDAKRSHISRELGIVPRERARTRR